MQWSKDCDSFFVHNTIQIEVYNFFVYDNKAFTRKERFFAEKIVHLWSTVFFFSNARKNNKAHGK